MLDVDGLFCVRSTPTVIYKMLNLVPFIKCQRTRTGWLRVPQTLSKTLNAF